MVKIKIKLVSSLLLCTFIFSSFFSQSLQELQESDGNKTGVLGRDVGPTSRNTTGFRIRALRAALDRARYAQGCVADLEARCTSRRKRLVWRDCSRLVGNAVLALNRTVAGLGRREVSGFDGQTWLSAALTSLETCYSGARELNVSGFVAPVRSSNATEMIRNGLAVNHYFLQRERAAGRSDGFPVWVTLKDRRLLSSSIYAMANVTVSKAPGSKFPTIRSAMDYAARIDRRNGRFIVYIKGGVYRENVEIGNDLNNIMFLGDGLRFTIITGDRSVVGGFSTYSSATVGVDGAGFIARGITFRNTAGPEKAQAVALRSASDLSVFYGCSFEGYQDTLFVHSQRQFFKLCYVYGTIDFMFGNAAVVLQNCMIYARKPLHGQANIITAQGRGDPFQNTGISIHNSRVMAAPDLKPVVGSVQTYLGRPWQEYSRTVFLKTFLDSHINPQGWSSWGNSDFAFNTLYYGEYGCFGPGATTKNRVRWPGYRVITSPSVASQFTVERLIGGRGWLRATGVPFIAGL